MTNSITNIVASAATNNVRIFTFNLPSSASFDVRTIVIDAEPWFVGRDVCIALGYADAVNAMKQHCKGVVKHHPLQTAGGSQLARVIPERDLYRLVMRSKLESAQQFEEWVVAEVLPSIRKTGQYGTPSAVPALPSVRDLALMVLASEDAKERAESERDKAKGELAIAAPKAAALDLISAGHDTLTFTEAAKVLGMKRAVLVAKMHASGWIYRQNSSWVAYDQHIKNGRLQYKEAHYTDEKTGVECVKPYCHITQKGLAKLAEATSLVEVAA